ncbi:TetR/AcrR family transcriptional regulator [Virgibacillus pantothenticus]|uniref:TetR/AcrR family transcriptional regulator n=1 Tax=Virgibacillus pantothenticus TaxID=1473 RepID=UPI00098425DE|nr:TetR/AcrR family transcriptional regulator [Virgibacillus pantothenticus]
MAGENMDKQNDTQELQQVIENFTNTMRKEQQLSQSQLKILNAAKDLFSEKGYENSSTSEIAKLAGVAEITLFRNFKSKKNLLHQLLAPLIIQVSSPSILKEVITQFNTTHDETEEILEALMKDRLDLLEKNDGVLKVLIRECLNNEEVRQSVIHNITKPAQNEAFKFVNHRINNEEFRDVDSQAVVDLLFYIMFGYIISHHVLKLEGFTNDKEVMIQTIIDLFLHGVKK